MPLILDARVSDLLKAYGTGHWDYFTEERIVRIKMLSGLAYATIVVIWAAVAAVLFPFPIAPWDLNSLFFVSVFTSIILIAITRRVLSLTNRDENSPFSRQGNSPSRSSQSH